MGIGNLKRYADYRRGSKSLVQREDPFIYVRQFWTNKSFPIDLVSGKSTNQVRVWNALVGVQKVRLFPKSLSERSKRPASTLWILDRCICTFSSTHPKLGKRWTIKVLKRSLHFFNLILYKNFGSAQIGCDNSGSCGGSV